MSSSSGVTKGEVILTIAKLVGALAVSYTSIRWIAKYIDPAYQAKEQDKHKVFHVLLLFFYFEDFFLKFSLLNSLRRGVFGSFIAFSKRNGGMNCWLRLLGKYKPFIKGIVHAISAITWHSPISLSPFNLPAHPTS